PTRRSSDLKGFVSTLQASFINLRAAPEDFGDIVPGEFHMDSPGDSAEGPVNFEESADFIQHIFQTSSLITVRRRERDAVHRIGNPSSAYPFVRNPFHQRRQDVANLSSTHTTNEGEPTRLIFRVQFGS